MDLRVDFQAGGVFSGHVSLGALVTIKRGGEKGRKGGTGLRGSGCAVRGEGRRMTWSLGRGVRSGACWD